MSDNIFFTDAETSIDNQEIRQRFTLPDNFELGEDPVVFTPRDPIITQLLPNIIGFGFLARIDLPDNDVAQRGELDDEVKDSVEFDWALVDRTTIDDNVIRTGTYKGATNLGKCWIDVFFDPHDPVPTQRNSKFEFRIGRPKKQDPAPLNVLYQQTPAPISSVATPVSDNDIFVRATAGVSEVTNYALIYRVWADTGESGKDVLGNEYRTGVRRDAATAATDNNYQTAWISQPSPSPTAVEALYFDVRHVDRDTSALIPSIIDSIRLDPFLPGVRMHVYYSNEGVTVSGTPARAPQVLTEWDQLLWTHVQQTYVLDKKRLYDLPAPVRASWIKLEFTNLQPVPFKADDFPSLPAITYREFPQVVVDHHVRPFRVSEDHFIKNEVRVQGNIFDVFQPDRADLDYNKRFQDLLTATETNTGFQQAATQRIDAITLGRIYYSSTQTNFGPNLATQMDTTNVLGVRQQQIATSAGSSRIFEVVKPRSIETVRVSNLNDRTTNVIAVPDIYFNEQCRHEYKLMKAKFNGKAYAAGARGVEFLRDDFTTVQDTPLIHDSLADPSPEGSPLVEVNSWIPDPGTTIPAGRTCYISYDVDYGAQGVVSVVNEIVQFEAVDATDYNFTAIPLSTNGARAINVQLWDGLNNTGNRYTTGIDYTMVYDSESFANSIARNELHFRLTAT